MSGYSVSGTLDVKETCSSGDESKSPGIERVDLDRVIEACEAVELLTVSDPGGATSVCERLIGRADQLGNAALRVRTRRAMAQAKAYTGQFHDALMYCQDAITIGSAAKETVETARARMASLHALASLGRFDEAIRAGLVARSELSAEGEDELAARVDLNLGAVFAMSDDPASALVYFDRARPAFFDQSAILAQLDTNRGNALAAIDNYVQASVAFESAVSSFKRAEQPLAAAIAEGNQGYLAARRGLIQQAMRHFEGARRQLDTSDARAHRARLIAEQAEVVATLGLLGDAIDSLEQVIPELDASSQRIEAARARVALSRALIGVGRFDAAGESIASAITAFTELGQPIDLGRAQLSAAGLAVQCGDLVSANVLVSNAAVGLADRPADLAVASTVAARVHLSSGDLVAAAAAIQQALSIAQQLELAPVEAESHVLAGRLRRAQGQPAIREFNSAVELTEQIRGTLQAGMFRSSFQSDRIAPYVELLAEAIRDPSAGAIAIAFKASELIKSRGLLDVIDDGLSAASETADDSTPTEIDIRTQLHSVREELNWRYSRIAEPSFDHVMHGRVRQLEHEAKQLETKLSATATSGDPGLAPVELSEALANLQPDTVAVSYSTVGDELIAFVLRDGSCTIHRNLSNMRELEHSLRRFRLQVARAYAHGKNEVSTPRLLDDVRRELYALWKAVFEPIQTEISGVETIAIVPGGPLHMAPFGALWNGSSYVIQEAAITVVPSLSILTRLSMRDVDMVEGRRLVVGVADENAPRISDEARSISMISAHCDLLVDEGATADQVSALIPGASTLHFACHGRFSRDYPNASGLKLWDRWLTLSEISRLNLRGAHVTLSACDTGRTALHAVEELVGLSSGFYAAGARSMIMSLWPVDDSHTVDMMTSCYQQRNTGASFADSLRSSQLSAIVAEIHPAHWAPFTFGGRV